MAKEGDSASFGVRMPESLKEEIEAYAKKEDISRNKALERLVEKGLDVKQPPVNPGKVTQRIATFTVNSALVGFFAAWMYIAARFVIAPLPIASPETSYIVSELLLTLGTLGVFVAVVGLVIMSSLIAFGGPTRREATLSMKQKLVQLLEEDNV